MNHAKHRLWTKNFILISAVNLGLSLLHYLLVVLMASYSVDTFNASTSQAGIVSSIFFIGLLIGRLYIGKNIEKFGYQKVLIIGVSLTVLITSLYLVQIGLAFLILVRLIHGIMIGIALTATNTIAAIIIPTEKRGAGIGYFSLSTIIGTAIGPFLAIFMMQHASYELIFVSCISIVLIGLLLSFFISIPQTTRTVEVQANRHLA